ncbi:MAG TPA: FAD-dependent oxidoreductase [Pyrinomonadaceae bacterium]|jgi:protoporphyrinogen oxidase
MRIGILGAGVAGLSSAYFLRGEFPDLQVHEASGHVGGLARSFKWHGFDCDLAPHRLYTDDEALLQELLALVPMARLRRRSRIYLQGKWIRDPVNAPEILLKFLPRRSLRVMWHYLFRRAHAEDSFEALVLSKFGAGLNELFFKPYSEKLFGIPADEISADWGRRKIRVSGLRDMLQRRSKLYFKDFYYPLQHGYGATCERLYAEIRDNVRLESRLTALSRTQTGSYLCTFTDRAGAPSHAEFDALISTVPLNYLAHLLGLELSLRFRPARITYLLLDRPRATDNHWFYFADRDFIINRVAEFKNFASNGVPADRTVLCCEVTEVDKYSTERVIAELTRTGIIAPRDVLDVKMIELPHAYPIYDRGYEREMERARAFFAAHPDIYHVGRQARFAHKDIDEIFAEAKRVANRLIARKHGAAGAEL